MSKIGELWDIVYGKLCGVHFYVKPWLFQWLFFSYFYRDLKHALLSLKGQILDVGCGKKHTENGSIPDILVTLGERWQIESESLDAAICTQVLKHVGQPEQLLHEIHRILNPNGSNYIDSTLLFSMNTILQMITGDGLETA